MSSDDSPQLCMPDPFRDVPGRAAPSVDRLKSRRDDKMYSPNYKESKQLYISQIIFANF